MKSLKAMACAVCVAMAAGLLQGCVLLVAGGAAAGTVSYVDNELHATVEVRFEKAWVAANAALKSLKMPVTSSNKDAAYGKLESRNAQDQPVVIQVTRKSEGVTQVRVRVGTFSTAANKAGAQLVYDHMKARF